MEPKQNGPTKQVKSIDKVKGYTDV